MGRTALLTFAGLLALLLVAGTAVGQGEDPNTQADRWLTSEQTITFDRVPGGAEDETGGPPAVAVNGTIRLHQFQYEGDTYSADKFREYYDKNFIGDDAVRKMEAEVRGRFNDSLQAMLPLKGPPSTTPADLTEESLNAGYGDDRPYHPPLVFHPSGGGDLDVVSATGGDATPKEMGVALELGATLEFPLDLGADPGENLTVHLQAPEGLAWNVTGDVSGVQARGETQLVNETVENWKGVVQRNRKLPLQVTDPAEEPYRDQRIDLDVTVDLQGVDVQPTRIPSGSFGEGRGKVTVRGELAVVELPESAPSALRDAGVTHVAADDVRLLVEEGLVERSTVENRVSNLTDGIVSDTPDQVDVVFSGGLVPESLAGVDREPNDTARPVRLEFNADVFVDLSAGAAGGGGARSAALYTLDRSFTFPSLKGFDTTYKVILPKGMSLENVDAPGATPETGTTEDGRDYFRLDVEGGGEQEATVAAAFTESFLWHQAPELLLLLLLLLLVPILVVARLVMGGGQDEEPTRVEAPGPDE